MTLIPSDTDARSNATVSSQHDDVAEAPVAAAKKADSTGRLVLQFFLGPLLIVLICAGIYFLFGLVVFDKKTPTDFLREIRTGSASERWQAAFELSRWFATSQDAVKDPRFAGEIVALFRDARREDPRVRRYLALALGRLGDRGSVGPLIESLEDETEDPETRLYAAWSLGALEDPAALPTLVRLLDSDDPGMVKMASYALGAIGDRSAAPRLQALLGHPSTEVRWNAALALAQLDDPSGLTVLLAMTREDALANVDGITEQQKVEATTNALRALQRLGTPEGKARIHELRTSSPYMEVRQVAVSLEDNAP